MKKNITKSAFEMRYDWIIEEVLRRINLTGTGSSIQGVAGSDGKDGTNGLDGNVFTGWAAYNDTQYTEASPLTILANTLTNLPNNKGFVLESQKPTDIATFYDGTAILGRNGDGLAGDLTVKIKPSINRTTVKLLIDIGGTVGEIYPTETILDKGASVEHIVHLRFPSGYTLDTWEANGGTVKIISDEAVDIYGINYLLTRTHKAR